MKMQVRHLNKVLWLFVISLFVVGIVYSQHKNAKKSQSGIHEPASTAVRVSSVSRQELPIKIEALGTLEAINAITVTPQLAGQIKKINFKDGDLVNPGDVLFEIDSDIHQGNVDAAKADLFLAAIEYNRAKKLVESKAMTQQFLDKANAENRQKQALLNAVQANLDHAIIKAPFSGNLGNRQVSVGDYVSVGQPLVPLIDIKHLKITYAVSEKNLAHLHQGQEVEFKTAAYPERVFKAKVSFVAPQIDIRDRTINLQAEFDNLDDLLSPGLFVKVTQYLGAADHVLTIPTQSLLAAIEGNKVYKVEDGKAVETPVEIGLRSNQFVEVIKGITENDQVIVEGQHKLKDGMAVTIIN